MAQTDTQEIKSIMTPPGTCENGGTKKILCEEPPWEALRFESGGV